MNGQNQIREYLLGSLEPAEADAFDTRLFLDEEFHDRVRAEQETLAEDFLAGSLPEEEAERFRAQCRRSAELRDVVAQSRTLQLALERRWAAERAKAAERTPRPAFSWRFLGLPVLAGAVCALLVTAAMVRIHQPATRVEAPQIATHDPAPALPQSAPEAPQQTFFLAAGTKRGVADLPVLGVAARTTSLKLQVEVRHDLESVPAWRIELNVQEHDPDHGQKTLLADGARAEHAGGQTFLVCVLDMARLADGAYSLRMTPVGASGPTVTRKFVLRRKR